MVETDKPIEAPHLDEMVRMAQGQSTRDYVYRTTNERTTKKGVIRCLKGAIVREFYHGFAHHDQHMAVAV